ncbi:MAG: hypothetical protein F6K42_11130 [Leptolyngbya sp. SIO1D8]|nr:hypothetical protein [Leptolyngbya sp. SIO1D8]
MKINEQKMTVHQPKSQQLFRTLDTQTLEKLKGGDTVRIPVTIKHGI